LLELGPWQGADSIGNEVPSDQPQRQLTPILVPFNEIRDLSGQLAHLQIATAAQFAGDFFGDIFRPAVGGIEGDDANRVIILADQEVSNDRFEVGAFVIGFAPRRGLIASSATR
jgi:hypothetical protein